MTDTIGRGVIEVDADSSGLKAGVEQAKRSLGDLTKAAEDTGRRSAKGIDAINAGGDKAARKVESSTKQMIASIQRQIVATESGSRSNAKYFEAIARQRGVSADVLRPYLAQLEKATAAGAKVERSMAGMANAGRLMGTVFAGVTFGALVGKLKETEREFGVLQSSLKTATGSSDAARDKFAELEKTAGKLPESLNDTVGAFIRLKNLGLDPSEKSLLSYSNTASAMGKNLNQMIEAVADASTGEFERLKEFGIRASKEGESVTFTFRGVEKTVKATSENIQQYLLALGNVEFAGAAADRMETLDGALSNLGDSWDGLFRKINAAGAGNAMTAAVKEMTAALNDPKAVEAAQALASGVVNAFTFMAKFVSATVVQIRSDAESVAEFIHGPIIGDIDGLQERLEKLRKTREQTANRGPGPAFPITQNLDAEIAKLQTMLDMSKQLAAPSPSPQKAAPTTQTPKPISSTSGGGLSKEDVKLAEFFSKGLDQTSQKFDELGRQALDNTDLMKRVAAENAAYFDGISNSLTDARTNVSTISEFLMTDEERLKESYARRQGMLDQAHEYGLVSEERFQQLKTGLEEKYNEESASLNQGYWEKYLEAAEKSLTSFDELAGSVVENFSGSFGDAFESIVFDATSMGDAIDQLAEGMARSVVNALGQMAAQWLAYQAVQLLVGQTGQAAAASAMIANATATAGQAMLAAFASTAAIPIVGPALAPGAAAAAAAATSPIVATISTAALAGIAHGGMDSIPREGTWLLDGGERVVAPQQNKDLTNFMKNGGGGINVTIIEDRTRAGTVDQSGDSIAVYVARVREAVSSDIASGGTAIARALESTYGLGRSAGARR